MKKISYIIIGGVIALASCNNMPAVDTAKQQAHIDSVVNAFLDTQKATLQKTCDDQIMQAAQDSAKVILEEEKKKGMHHWAPKPAPKKVEPAKPAAPTGATGRGNTTTGTATGRATTTSGQQTQGKATGRGVK